MSKQASMALAAVIISVAAAKRHRYGQNGGEAVSRNVMA